MKLSENIKRLRESQGLSLEDVAKRIGVSRQTVHRYENGSIQNPPLDKILALSKALNSSPRELMGWEDPETNELREDMIEAIEARLPSLSSDDLKVLNDLTSRLSKGARP